MSDPLSIAASVVGIAAAGFQIAKGLYQIADGVGSAGEEVRIAAREIDAFSKLLTIIRAELSHSNIVSVNERGILQDILSVCNDVLQPLKRLQERLAPLLTRFKHTPGRLTSFGLRINYIFSCKDKLIYYRRILRDQTSVLNTLLSLMSLQRNTDKARTVV
jgi:hypothetical protein